MAALLFLRLSKQYGGGLWEGHTRQNHQVFTAHPGLVFSATEQRSSTNLIMEGGPFSGLQTLPLGFPGTIQLLELQLMQLNPKQP